MKLKWNSYILNFIEPGGTSRGVMTTRKVWFLYLSDETGLTGIGECAPLPGLSCERIDEIETILDTISIEPDKYFFNLDLLIKYPSIRFALESAILDLKNGGKSIYYPSEFSDGNGFIKINGLIWMGSKEKMLERVNSKIQDGFHCLKFKIGAINFDEEYDLIQSIRNEFNASELEIRVDANGAFNFDEAKHILDKLARLDLHSIEQPLKAGNIKETALLCKSTPLPIVLDEELIGIHTLDAKNELIEQIKPQYIILKPSLTGGFKSSEEWISIAESNSSDWWITSALESNVGLNAIAQWTYILDHHKYHGLGTGKVFSNNLPSAIATKGEKIFIDKCFV